MSDIVERLRDEAKLEVRLRDSTRMLMEEGADEITRLRAGLQKIVQGDGFWDAPSLARDLLEGKDVT
jgi:hypothetical protein